MTPETAAQDDVLRPTRCEGPVGCHQKLLIQNVYLLEWLDLGSRLRYGLGCLEELPAPIGDVQHEPEGTIPVVHARLLTLLCEDGDRKSTRLNSSHLVISYAVFCLKKKKKYERR